MEDRRRALAATRGRPRHLAGAVRRVASACSLALMLASTVGVAPSVLAAPTGKEEIERAARSRSAQQARLEGADARVISLLEAVKNRTDVESALLGESLWRLGRMADARKTWSGCATAIPCALAQGQRELRAGDRTIALKVLTKALAKHQNDIELRAALGEALYRVGQDVSARKMLDPLADLYEAGRDIGDGPRW